MLHNFILFSLFYLFPLPFPYSQQSNISNSFSFLILFFHFKFNSFIFIIFMQFEFQLNHHLILIQIFIFIELYQISRRKYCNFIKKMKMKQICNVRSFVLFQNFLSHYFDEIHFFYQFTFHFFFIQI